MTHAEAVISRCTRNGVTSWQHVAAQLGRSVDSVRAQFDQSYMRAHIWAPSREAQPEMELEEPPPADADIPTNAPYERGPTLKMQILWQLQLGPRCADTLATRLQRPVNSIRARLNSLQTELLVCNDGRDGRFGDKTERTWSLTAKGLRLAVTRCAIPAKERV